MTRPIGFNYQAGTGDCPYRKLVIVDQGQAPAAAGDVLRYMHDEDVFFAPEDAIVQFWNERRKGEMPDTATCIAFLERLKAARPDLQLVYPGDVVDPPTGWSYEPDPALVPYFKFYGLHAAAWSPVPPATLHGLAVIVTEWEFDPEHPEQLELALPWARACPAPAYFFIWIWRGGDQRVNFAAQPDLCRQLAELSTGDIAMADSLEERVAALERRDALITQACERIIEGDWQGASGAAADVVALKGGVDDVSGKVLPGPKQ